MYTKMFRISILGGYPRYRFQKGRHSGSFFLKTGMAAFCFGHLIYEGLILAKVKQFIRFRLKMILTE